MNNLDAIQLKDSIINHLEESQRKITELFNELILANIKIDELQKNKNMVQIGELKQSEDTSKIDQKIDEKEIQDKIYEIINDHLWIDDYGCYHGHDSIANDILNLIKKLVKSE
jgi:hypothetical protein